MKGSAGWLGAAAVVLIGGIALGEGEGAPAGWLGESGWLVQATPRSGTDRPTTTASAAVAPRSRRLPDRSKSEGTGRQAMGRPVSRQVSGDHEMGAGLLAEDGAGASLDNRAGPGPSQDRTAGAALDRRVRQLLAVELWATPPPTAAASRSAGRSPAPTAPSSPPNPSTGETDGTPHNPPIRSAPQLGLENAAPSLPLVGPFGRSTRLSQRSVEAVQPSGTTTVDEVSSMMAGPATVGPGRKVWRR